MKNLFLILFFIVSFIISGTNHQNNHLNLSSSVPQNQTSNIAQKRPKIEEIYDEDEFDTTGVDVESLDLTNVNTGIRNNVNVKPTENLKESEKNKENQNIIKDSRNNLANKTDKIESNIHINYKNEDSLNKNLNDFPESLQNNEIVHYNSDDDMKYKHMNEIESHIGSSIEEINGPPKKKSKRGFNGMGGMGNNEYLGRHGNMGGSMGDHGNMGGSNMNNFQNFNNSNDKGYFHHIYEMMMCFFLIMFFYNLICGKSNHRLTQNWFDVNKEFFKQNYKKIGISEDLLEKLMKRSEKGLPLLMENEKKDEKNKKIRKINLYKEKTIQEPKLKKEKKPKINILQQAVNVFKFFAFNKNNVKQMVVNFEYRRSNDYFSTFSGGIFYNERDHINYQFALNTYYEIPTVFCLCRGVEAKTFKKSYPDIDFFTRPYQPSFLSDYHLLFAESSEIFIDIFRNKNILASFKKIEQYLEILYFTDRKTFLSDNQSLYFGFELYMDQFSAKQIYKDINDFVHQFIDELCLIDITEKVKREALKNRQEFEQMNQKQNESDHKPNKDCKLISEERKEISNIFQGGRIFKRKIRGLKRKPKEKKKI